METMQLVVNGQHGIYAYHVLATQYPLYINDGPITGGKYVELSEWLRDRADMDGETVETVFHPDNEESSENIEYCAYHNILAVKHDNGEYWRVDSIDSDIWAINPLADWDDESETYVINQED